MKTLIISFILSITFSVVFVFGQEKQSSLVIYHTNDTHSQIDPISMKDRRNANKGGVVRRASAIHQFREKEGDLLLLDAGDFFQGTPYFNFFNGDVEIKTMNQLGYDAVCIGNHELDNGVDFLAKALSKATFPLVCANYDVSKTALAPYVKPYVILNKQGLKIGVIGIGINPDGLVSKKNWEGIVYNDPIQSANEWALYLKQVKKCDLVICLSHLGCRYKPNENAIGDEQLAHSSYNIDIIIGAHTHTFMKEPMQEQNMNGDLVIINQVGKSGINLGRLEVVMGK